MDSEVFSLPKTTVFSSTDTGGSSKSASTAKRIRTQDEPTPFSQEGNLTPQYPAYRGVHRRSWGKWVSEIKEPTKKSIICLGCFDSPEMAARAYDVAEVYLKGKKHAVLNFPDMIDHIPHPISLSRRHIQAAAAEAVVAFSSASMGNIKWSSDSNKRTRRSPRNPPVSNEPPSSCSSDFESASVELSGQTGTSNSSSVCTPTEGVGDCECVVVEDDLFESFNLFTNLAEALLLPPPPLFILDEEHNFEEGFLWSDS